MNFRKMAKLSAELLKEKKGRGIIILDVRKISDFTDYLVIASGTSDTHIKTLFSEVEENLPILLYKKEIKNKTKWAVLDYGGFVVHIMHSDSRKFYNIESNWGMAKKVIVKPRSARKRTRRKTERIRELEN
ncbi:MAG: ribosome silencing factor [Elusimicrobia bacterium CG06_land_8_20_14_3_00_38_11]|nr:MAG: ribosome silencing factor [Elusimicrobia bacterium CG06_land_8_20_14_3_00_38_11]